MMVKRSLERIYRPEGEPGFLGSGHTARPVINGSFSQTDPFIMLMDDILDKKDNEPVGGAHPHAGFETVSLLLEGEMGDNAHKMSSGDFQMMTAGSGIVHTETIDKKAKMRLLQMWLNLPKKDRNAMPRVQDLPLAHVPTLSVGGVNIRLYSGSLSGLSSPVQNYTPVIIADVLVEKGVTTIQEIPGNYNSFIYVLEGRVQVGEEGRLLEKDEVGWLNIIASSAASSLILKAGEDGVRLVLYSGKPLGEPIVSYGPFIADSTEDIKRLYQEYREGKMNHISTVPATQRISL